MKYSLRETHRRMKLPGRDIQSLITPPRDERAEQAVAPFPPCRFSRSLTSHHSPVRYELH